MIPEISKKEIHDFIFSAKKQKENSDFVKELVGTPFSDCTIEELKDELIDYVNNDLSNKTHQENLDILISDYYAIVKTQRDFDINEMETMLKEPISNYNKGKMYALYTDEEHRYDLTLSVYKAIKDKGNDTEFKKSLDFHMQKIIVENEFDEKFEEVCRKLFKDTKITQIFDLLQQNFKQYGKAFLKDEGNEKLDEISRRGDLIREKLKEELKSEFDRALIEPNDFEMAF